MARISVNNATDALLGLFVEPWGTDHWMRPGEVFTVVTGAEVPGADRVDPPFEVVVHADGISVGVNISGSAEVFDAKGTPVPCGHQRPENVFKDAAT